MATGVKSIEQSIQHSATSLYGLFTVKTIIEGIFVCLRPRRTSDFSFVLDAPCINSLTYLLTYLRLTMIVDIAEIDSWMLYAYFVVF